MHIKLYMYIECYFVFASFQCQTGTSVEIIEENKSKI
jgi:hypothetical protein